MLGCCAAEPAGSSASRPEARLEIVVTPPVVDLVVLVVHPLQVVVAVQLAILSIVATVAPISVVVVSGWWFAWIRRVGQVTPAPLFVPCFVKGKKAPCRPFDRSQPLRIAVVQWTHTLKMRNALLLARRQLLRSALLEHHIVLQSCGGPLAMSCPALRTGVLPLRKNVTCFDAADMLRLVPATRQIAQGATLAGGHWRKHMNQIGSVGWCWTNCDAAYIAWFQVRRRQLTHVTHFWFMEWDVLWTGDLAEVILAFSGYALPPDPDGALRGATAAALAVQAEVENAAVATADFLCPGASKATRGWKHLHERNISHLDFEHTWMCVTNLFRLSHRLMHSVAEYANLSEAGMFCEMRTASVCRLEGSWCTMRSIFDLTHKRYLFRDEGGWASTYTTQDGTYEPWKMSLGNDMRRQNIEAVMNRSVLLHGYKWPSNESILGPDGVVTLYEDRLLDRQLGHSTCSFNCTFGTSRTAVRHDP